MPETSAINNGVTIGIPVYNEEARIDAAVRSVVGQCEKLIISDNASTDRTSELCSALAAEFDNIEYHLQPENIGGLKNWLAVQQHFKTEFCMLMGAHDLVDANYVATLRPLLEADASVLGAFGLLEYEYEADGSRHVDESLENWRGGMLETSAARVQALLYSRVPVVWAVYGLYRTRTLREMYSRPLHPYGVDVMFLANLLSEGKLQMSSATRYHGWIRDNRGNRFKYLDRLLHGGQSQDLASLKNEFRIAKHELIRDTLALSGFVDEFRYRMLSTIYFGTFKYPGMDPLFYLTYPAAKITRRVIRTRRKLAR